MSRTGPPFRLEPLEPRDVPAAVGALDPSYGTAGKVLLDLGGSTEEFHAVALEPDGRAVAVGTTNAGGTFDFVIVRLNPDGTPDASFNRDTGKQVIDFGGGDAANAVAIQPDGKIVVVGHGGANADFCYARLNADGTLDTGFGGPGSGGKATLNLGGNDFAFGVGLQSTGKIVVGGYSDFSGHYGFDAVRLNADGTPDVTVGNALGRLVDFHFTPSDKSDSKAFAMAVYGPGPNADDIVLVGESHDNTFVTFPGPGPGFEFTASSTTVAVLTLDPNGAVIANSVGATVNTTGLGTGFVEAARAVVIAPGGEIVVGGYVNGFGGEYDDWVIQRFTGPALAHDPTLNVSPEFSSARGPGTVVHDLGLDDLLYGLALQPDGKIVGIGASSPTGTINPTGYNIVVARFNRDGSPDNTFNAPTFDTIVGLGRPAVAYGGVLQTNGRILAVGTNGVDLAAVRLTGTVERPRGLAVGGGPGATASIFVNSNGNVPVRTTPAGLFPAFSGSSPPPPFTGDVRPATGDVNGDGIEDTILLTGEGAPGRMAVINGKDNSVLLAPTDPYGDPAGFAGGGFVTAGDIDGDGRAEWVITPDLTGGPRVIIFGLNPDGTLRLVANFFGIQDPSFRDGARAALGDVNGDGILDVFCIAAFNGGPRTALFDGKDVLVHLAQGRQPTKLTGDFFATTTGTDTGRGGRSIAAGDIDGDGRADYMVTGETLTGDVDRVTVYSGADLISGRFPGFGATVLADFRAPGLFTSGSVTTVGGINLASVDADGDNQADLVVGAPPLQPGVFELFHGRVLVGLTQVVTVTPVEAFDTTTLHGTFVG
jgi:uncharacterized delta-60 repeat protein